VRRESRDWLSQAEADLETANDCFTSRHFYAAAFFCQQAVEKGLKALYIERKRIAPPRTHNLAQISEELDAPSDVLSVARSLTPEFVISRYPDAAGGPPYELYDEQNTKPILEGAAEVMSWIRAEIEKLQG